LEFLHSRSTTQATRTDRPKVTDQYTVEETPSFGPSGRGLGPSTRKTSSGTNGTAHCRGVVRPILTVSLKYASNRANRPPKLPSSATTVVTQSKRNPRMREGNAITRVMMRHIGSGSCHLGCKDLGRECSGWRSKRWSSISVIANGRRYWTTNPDRLPAQRRLPGGQARLALIHSVIARDTDATRIDTSPVARTEFSFSRAN